MIVSRLHIAATVLVLSYSTKNVISFSNTPFDGYLPKRNRQQQRPHHNQQEKHTTTHLDLSAREDEYYGKPGGSSMVKELFSYDQLEDIINLASQPLPERPDGIVSVVKFTSATREDCKATEAEYERMARSNPDAIFLRCFEDYENADMLLGRAEVSALPCFDIFYGGKRVGRIEGPDHPEVEEYVKRFGFINSKLDLFSEEADNKRKLKWGDGKAMDASKTPRTTARFLPGYDWDTKKGFFDTAADKAMNDFESTYENWTPNVNDD